MATIPYIGSRQKVTASKMNALWSEFDRKMTLMMDGKSWLLFETADVKPRIAEIMGRKFWFTNLTTFGRSVSLGGSSPNYTHSSFTTAVAGASQVSVDHTNKIVVMDSFGAVNLDESLEAHRRATLNAESELEDYWVWQDGAVMPQRRHRFAVAELIFENSGLSAFTIPNSYDKYQYFRCHNFNLTPITVTFQALSGGTDFVLTVPGLGCKCVQRRPGGQMEAGYNYFWRFKAGDPRSLTTKGFNGNIAAETMRVNNVWNPALIYEVIELFSDRVNGLGIYHDPCNVSPVRMIRDPHIIYEIDDLHRGYFADPAVTSNLLGDILHHKGVVHYCYRDSGDTLQRVIGKFNGYGSALSSLTAMGLTVVSGASNVTIQGPAGSEFNDLVTPGTNLLYEEDGTVVTAAEISSARTIEHRQPDDGAEDVGAKEGFVPVTVGESTETKQYQSFSVDADLVPSLGALVDVSYDAEKLVTPAKDVTTELKPHVDTIETALLFNTFGLVSLVGTNQNSDITTLQNRRIVLTAFGPVILWEQKYTFNVGVVGTEGDVGSVFSPGRPYMRIDGDGKLIEHRFMTWGGYGWPAFPKISQLTGLYNGSHGGFISPRRTRAVNGFSGGGAHPNYGNPLYGADGSDFTIVPVDREQTEIRLLFTPGYASPGIGHMPVWSAGDKLVEYEDSIESETSEGDYVALRADMQSGAVSGWMPRVKMLREHYNTMASWVNSCVKCRPFGWSDFRHYLPATTEAGWGVPEILDDPYDTGLQSAESTQGLRGLFGTTVRPLGQYTAFLEDSFLHHLFEELGVPILTESDLQSAFTTALSTQPTTKFLRGGYNIVIDSATEIFPDVWRYKQHNELTSLEWITDTNPNPRKISRSNANQVFDAVVPSYPGTDDTLEVDYLWVSIPAVKAAAEGMGLKFLYEEMCMPLALQEFNVGPGIDAIVDHSTYSYFEEASEDPRPLGVAGSRTIGVNFALDEFPTLSFEQLRFVASSTPLWKRTWPYRSSPQAVADTVPADVLTMPIVSAGFVIHLSSASADYCTYDYELRTPAAELKRRMLYQIAASPGFTIGSGAWKIPVPWITHATNDFSLQSDDNARARKTFTNEIYPFVVSGSYGAASRVTFGSGNNIIAPAAGQAEEVVIWQNTYVDLT